MGNAHRIERIRPIDSQNQYELGENKTSKRNLFLQEEAFRVSYLQDIDQTEENK